MAKKARPPKRMATRFLPVAALVALATACVNGDATAGQLREAMTNAGVDGRDARCIAEEAEDTFNQEELNEIAGASELDDVSTSLHEQVDTILAECLSNGDGADDDTNEGDGGDGDGGDTSSEADSEANQADG